MMRIAAAAVMVGLMGCASSNVSPSPIPVDPAAAMASLMAADAAYGAAARSTGLADAFPHWAADEVSFLAPGAEVLRGRDAARLTRRRLSTVGSSAQ